MPTRIVWITLLAMADKHGIAEGSIPGLATFARVSLKDCRKALRALQSPDRDSRSKAKDGRRIEPVDGGWHLINHGKYRAKLGEDERREYLRIKKAEQRLRNAKKTEKPKKKAMSTRRQQSQQCLPNVNSVPQMSTASTHAEAEAEAVDQDQDQVHRAPRGPLSRGAQPPKTSNPKALHLIARDVLRANPTASIADWAEELKTRAAHAAIDYDATSISKALGTAERAVNS